MTDTASPSRSYADLPWIRNARFDAGFIFGVLAMSATIVLYQIVNFHHYMVDSKIWKLRKPKIQQTLDLDPNG